mgnify:CR=1 FL=1
MPNIAQVLKEEIRRLAKKEAKALTTNLKKDVVKLKKSNVAMRRVVVQLKRDNDLLMAAEKRRQQSQPVIPPENASKARITAKGIRAMRKKLGLSQTDFAKLVGVSVQIVCIWEKKDGALRLRDTTRAALLALRGIGAREAKRRLELVAAKKAVKGRRKLAKGKRAKK